MKDFDKNDRTIDDPGLNQDSTFDKKDEEDFDDSDDFHKYDDTDDGQESDSNESETKESKADSLNVESELDKTGRFDGSINI